MSNQLLQIKVVKYNWDYVTVSEWCRYNVRVNQVPGTGRISSSYWFIIITVQLGHAMQTLMQKPELNYDYNWRDENIFSSVFSQRTGNV